VERLGADTTAVEEFVRTAERVEGRLLERSPVTRVATFRADLGPDGRVRRFDVRWMTPAENPSGPPPASASARVTADSAILIRVNGDDVDTVRLALAGAFVPVLGHRPLAPTALEQVLRRARSVDAARFDFTYLYLSSGRTAKNFVVRQGPDSVMADFFGFPIYARIDARGRVESISGRETTMKMEVRRVESVDFDALATRFAALDAHGGSLGQLSPGAEVSASAGGAHFEIKYSQPGRRGRKIWGALVPWDKVWRTGANAATEFRTDRDLDMGGARVPAGTYTLWSRFTPHSAELIINRETGIWGTAYDAAHDLAHVPLESEQLAESVERFTIAVEPAANGARLTLTWGNRRLSVPLRVLGESETP